MELHNNVGSIFEIAMAAHDVAFGAFLVAVAVGAFLLGCWSIGKVISWICNNTDSENR